MKPWISPGLALGGVIILLFATGTALSAHPDDEPEGRARAFLDLEVPQWNRENRCFSCHNNGDGARALFDSAPKKPDELAETVAFLSHPERWDKNGVDAAFSDKRLARLQFAAALEAAVKAGRIADRAPLIQAATMLANDQADDGSWAIDEAAPVGSPTTYGPPLATAMAIRTLRGADRGRFRDRIEKAEAWFRKRAMQNVQDAAAALLAMSPETDRKLTLSAIDFLRKAQNPDGGWGPFVRSASEPFDTAVALLGIANRGDRGASKEMIRRGRDFLIKIQKEDGSWPETTRPAGAESYAQRISTTGWAAMALFATRPDRLKL